MRKQINLNLLLKNKLFQALLFVILFVVLATGAYECLGRYRLAQSPVYNKLQGDYQIILDSSQIYRSFEIISQEIVVVTIQIHDDYISLPNFNSYVNKKMSLFGYRWKVLSSNPDSILIDAYPHALHGKYKVSFKTYKSGTLGYTTDSYVYLDNDSTHLCLKKTMNFLNHKLP